MVFFNLFFFPLPTIFFYMFLYNLTLIGLIWIFISFYNKSFKTLFSLNVFSFDSPALMFVTLFLFSLAGVPPFIGFFSKIYLLNLLINQGFFTLYTLFVVLLIIGLYFYIQNIRFLHSTSHNNNVKPFIGVVRKPLVLTYYLSFWGFFVLNGFIISEDIMLYFFWVVF